MLKASQKKKLRRYKLWIRQEGRCRYCDRFLWKPDEGTFDHVLSRKNGGRFRIKNLALVCGECNQLKSWFSTYAEADEYCQKLMAFFERLRAKGIVE